MSGIAIDLGNLFSPVPNPLPSNTQRPLQVFAAQVIEVIVDESSKLYKSEKDIGAIRFRNLSKEVNKEEDLIKNIAYPLDRSIVRYPMPGEQVMIFAAIGEVPTGAVQSIKRTYFYMQLLLVKPNQDGVLTGELCEQTISDFKIKNPGHEIFAIVATAGSTNLGIIDDLKSVGDLAKKGIS